MKGNFLLLLLICLVFSCAKHEDITEKNRDASPYVIESEISELQLSEDILFNNNKELNTSGYGAIIYLLNNSSLDSGLISFKNENDYFYYEYKDDLTLIRVLSFIEKPEHADSEWVLLDTMSPDIQIFDIRVGISADELIKILGEPIGEDERNMYFSVNNGLLLRIELTEDKIHRIIYEPGLF